MNGFTKNPNEMNMLAQKIAMTDNKHDFESKYDQSTFDKTIHTSCLDRNENKPFNENQLLDTFNLERTEDNRFKFKEGTDVPYQIDYKESFNEMMNTMKDNTIIVIDMDYGGFITNLLEYLYIEPDKNIIIYNGAEVQYDPAGKMSSVKSMLTKNVNKDRLSFNVTDELRNNFLKRITIKQLQNQGQVISKKTNCQEEFTDYKQQFFSNRDIILSTIEKNAFAIIKRSTKNEFIVADKKFAEKTNGKGMSKALSSLVSSLKQMDKKKIKSNILKNLYSIKANFIPGKKLSPEHYIAKRLGDAGQALISKDLDNSILVTHDRVLLAFALSIGVPYIVFTHPPHRKNKVKEFPITIFRSQEVVSDESTIQNLQNDITSLKKDILSQDVKDIDKTNIERFSTTIIEKYTYQKRELENRIQILVNEIKDLFIQIQTLLTNITTDNLMKINEMYVVLVKNSVTLLTLIQPYQGLFLFNTLEGNKDTIMNLFNYTLPATMENLNPIIEQLQNNKREILLIKNTIGYMNTVDIIIQSSLSEPVLDDNDNNKKWKDIKLVKSLDRPTRIRNAISKLKNIINANELLKMESSLERTTRYSILKTLFESINNNSFLYDFKESYIIFLNTLIKNKNVLENGIYIASKLQNLLKPELFQKGGRQKNMYGMSGMYGGNILQNILLNIDELDEEGLISAFDEYIVCIFTIILKILDLTENQFIIFLKDEKTVALLESVLIEIATILNELEENIQTLQESNLEIFMATLSHYFKELLKKQLYSSEPYDTSLSATVTYSIGIPSNYSNQKSTIRKPIRRPVSSEDVREKRDIFTRKIRKRKQEELLRQRRNVASAPDRMQGMWKGDQVSSPSTDIAVYGGGKILTKRNNKTKRKYKYNKKYEKKQRNMKKKTKKYEKKTKKYEK